MKTILTMLLIFLLVCTGCAGEKPSVTVHPKNGADPVHVTVELARTSGQRSMGLMYRKRLGATRGMLFLFDREQKHSFTMRNTSLPLDIIFLDNTKAITGIIENTKPYSNGPYTIDRPSRYVLEVRAGFCAKNGIAAGDRIVFHNIPGHGPETARHNGNG